MISLKEWNSYTPEFRKKLAKVRFAEMGYLPFNIEDVCINGYHHSFDHDDKGKWLKDLLSNFYIQPDKTINVTVRGFRPVFAPVKPKPVRIPMVKAVPKTKENRIKCHEELSKGISSISDSELEKWIVTFGSKREGHFCTFNEESEWNSNYQFDSICVNKKTHEILVEIYWQGDDVDGEETFRLSDFRSKMNTRGGYYIPAEIMGREGGRTHFYHGDINIGKREFDDYLKIIAEKILNRK